MTIEEIRLECFGQAVSLAYSTSGGALAATNINNIIQIAQQIENYVLQQQQPAAVPTNLSGIQWGAIAGSASGSAPGIPLTQPQTTKMILEFSTQLLVDLHAGYQIDLLDEVEKHLCQFHRVNYTNNGTQDFSIVPSVNQLNSPHEINYNLQVSTRP